jgi:hypothetical protein
MTEMISVKSHRAILIQYLKRMGTEHCRIFF